MVFELVASMAVSSDNVTVDWMDAQTVVKTVEYSVNQMVG